MIDSVDHLKILQKEQNDIFSLKGELDKRKQRLEETKKLFTISEKKIRPNHLNLQ